MKWKMFTNKLQQEILEHQSDVDINSIWNAIEPEVNEINKTRNPNSGGGRFIWLALLSGFVLLSSFIYVYSSAEVQTTNTAPVVPATQEVSAEKTTVDNELSIISNEVKEEAQQSIVNTAPTVKKSLIETTSQSIKESVTLNNTVIKNKTIALSQTNNKVVVENSSVLNDVNRPAVVAIHNTSTNIDNIIVAEKTNDQVVSTTKTIIDKEEEEQVDVSQNISEIVDPTPSSNNLSVESDQALEEIAASTPIVEEIAVVEAENVNPLDEIAEEEAEDGRFNRQALSYAIGVHGGASFANRNFSSDQGLNDPLFQLRERTETTLETLHGGIDVSVSRGVGHNSSLEFTTGARYTRISERMGQNETTIRMDSVWGVIRYQIFNGDTTAIEGNIPVTITETFERKYYNHYELIDIPLLLGYHHEFENLSLGFQAGVLVNLSLKTKGKILQTEQQIVDLTEEKVFKSSVGASYYFAMSGRYLLTDAFQLTVAPFMQYYPGRFTVDNYALKQRYTLIGLNVGLRYKF